MCLEAEHFNLTQTTQLRTFCCKNGKNEFRLLLFPPTNTLHGPSNQLSYGCICRMRVMVRRALKTLSKGKLNFSVCGLLGSVWSWRKFFILAILQGHAIQKQICIHYPWWSDSLCRHGWGNARPKNIRYITHSLRLSYRIVVANRFLWHIYWERTRSIHFICIQRKVKVASASMNGWRFRHPSSRIFRQNGKRTTMPSRQDQFQKSRSNFDKGLHTWKQLWRKFTIVENLNHNTIRSHSISHFLVKTTCDSLFYVLGCERECVWERECVCERECMREKGGRGRERENEGEKMAQYFFRMSKTLAARIDSFAACYRIEPAGLAFVSTWLFMCRTFVFSPFYQLIYELYKYINLRNLILLRHNGTINSNRKGCSVHLFETVSSCFSLQSTQILQKVIIFGLE